MDQRDTPLVTARRRGGRREAPVAHGCTVDEAFELVRAYTRTHRLRLGEVAFQVTAQPDKVRALVTPARPTP